MQRQLFHILAEDEFGAGDASLLSLGVISLLFCEDSVPDDESIEFNGLSDEFDRLSDSSASSSDGLSEW